MPHEKERVGWWIPRAALWLVIGLARFAGLRRDEIAFLRGSWIEDRAGVVSIVLRDRPEEKFWTKTGKPYRAQVIDAEVSAWLAESVPPSVLKSLRGTVPLSVSKSLGGSVFATWHDGYTVPDPADGGERARWFERVPQCWLHAHGISAAKPLHRLRGLYADQVAALTADAVAARLAGIRAAQEALGHTTSAVTERHYLTPDALR